MFLTHPHTRLHHIHTRISFTPTLPASHTHTPASLTPLINPLYIYISNQQRKTIKGEPWLTEAVEKTGPSTPLFSLLQATD
jgi:hypothetical protein